MVNQDKTFKEYMGVLAKAEHVSREAVEKVAESGLERWKDDIDQLIMLMAYFMVRRDSCAFHQGNKASEYRDRYSHLQKRTSEVLCCKIPPDARQTDDPEDEIYLHVGIMLRIFMEKRRIIKEMCKPVME